MTESSVVITGVGIVSAVGLGVEAFDKSLKEGATGLKLGTLDCGGQTMKVVFGAVNDDALPACIEARRHLNFKHMSRSGMMVCAAAGLALKDGHFTPDESALERTGIVMGTAFGGIQSMLKFNADVREKGPSAVNPIIFPDTVSNAPAGYAAIAFGIRGMNATLSTGFASGFRALRAASEHVASGNLLAALAGGYDEIIPHLCQYWESVGELSKSHNDAGFESNPFDSRRDGFHPGEGAVVLLLEQKATAKQRGAAIYGEILGFGACQSSQNMKEAMLGALSEARMEPSDIAVVFASANGSIDADRDEAEAIHQIFGADTPVSAVKGYTGECIAAAGPAAVAAALFSLRSKTAPGIPGLKKCCKEIPINISPSAVAISGQHCCLINSFGRQGEGESLVCRPLEAHE